MLQPTSADCQQTHTADAGRNELCLSCTTMDMQLLHPWDPQARPGRSLNTHSQSPLQLSPDPSQGFHMGNRNVIQRLADTEILTTRKCSSNFKQKSIKTDACFQCVQLVSLTYSSVNKGIFKCHGK